MTSFVTFNLIKIFGLDWMDWIKSKPRNIILTCKNGYDEKNDIMSKYENIEFFDYFGI
jgi:hypothetical protein